MPNDNQTIELLQELGRIAEIQGRNLTRHEDALEAEAKTLRYLNDSIAFLEDKLNLAMQAIGALYPRNEYGLSEDEAKMAHGMISILLDGNIAPWQPWPNCHCQLDPVRSRAAFPYPEIERVLPYERGQSEHNLLG